MHSFMNYDSTHNQAHIVSVSQAHTLTVFLTLPKKKEYTHGTHKTHRTPQSATCYNAFGPKNVPCCAKPSLMNLLNISIAQEKFT